MTSVGYVCGSSCLSVCPRGYLRNHTRDLYHIFVYVAYVHGSVMLVDDRPHRVQSVKCNLRLPCFVGLFADSYCFLEFRLSKVCSNWIASYRSREMLMALLIVNTSLISK